MGAVWGFFDKHGLLGQIAGIGLFAIYFPVVIIFFLAHVVLWGIHSMIFGSLSKSPSANAWASVPFYGSAAIGIMAAILWTGALLALL